MEHRPSKSELEEAKEITREAIEKASNKLDFNTNPDVALGYTYKPIIVDKLGGASGETFNDAKIDIRFNTMPENWRANLKRTTAHEYAHTQFFDENPLKHSDTLWKVILGEAHSTNLAEKCFPEARPATIKSVDKKDLGDYWPEVKERISEELGWNNEIFFSDFYNHDIPMYYGYSLAFHIGQKLLENHKLRKFPELEKEDVIESGDQMFNKD